MSLLMKMKMVAKLLGLRTVRDAGRLSHLASGVTIESVALGGTMRVRTITIGAEGVIGHALGVRQNVGEMCLWESERSGWLEERVRAAIGAARRIGTKKKRKQSESMG